MERAAAQQAAAAYEVRPVEPGDAEEYVRCHVACLAETYASIMPPAFAEEHRRDAPAEVTRTRAEWQRAAALPGPRIRAWLARRPDGEVVGVVRSGPGMQDWEAALDAPPTTVAHQLHHLYTRQSVHGSGLGRRLLEAAVGPDVVGDAGSYLWILHGNARADRFYRRNGFAPDGDEMVCGQSWYHRTMYRMVRPAG